MRKFLSCSLVLTALLAAACVSSGEKSVEVQQPVRKESKVEAPTEEQAEKQLEVRRDRTPSPEVHTPENDKPEEKEVSTTKNVKVEQKSSDDLEEDEYIAAAEAKYEYLSSLSKEEQERFVEATDWATLSRHEKQAAICNLEHVDGYEIRLRFKDVVVTRTMIQDRLGKEVFDEITLYLSNSHLSKDAIQFLPSLPTLSTSVVFQECAFTLQSLSAAFRIKDPTQISFWNSNLPSWPLSQDGNDTSFVHEIRENLANRIVFFRDSNIPASIALAIAKSTDRTLYLNTCVVNDDLPPDLNFNDTVHHANSQRELKDRYEDRNDWHDLFRSTIPARFLVALSKETKRVNYDLEGCTLTGELKCLESLSSAITKLKLDRNLISVPEFISCNAIRNCLALKIYGGGSYPDDLKISIKRSAIEQIPIGNFRKLRELKIQNVSVFDLAFEELHRRFPTVKLIHVDTHLSFPGNPGTLVMPPSRLLIYSRQALRSAFQQCFSPSIHQYSSNICALSARC